MTKKNDSGNPWLEKLIIPIFVGLVLAGSSPWWFNELFKRGTVIAPTPPQPTPTISFEPAEPIPTTTVDPGSTSDPKLSPTPTHALTTALEPIPSPEPTPAPTLAPEPPAPTSEPTPIPKPASSIQAEPASANLEIRKQGYIVRAEGCRTTGEVGAVVCRFSIEAESERKELSLNGRDTFLVDSTGQRRRASRMDFGVSGSSTSARSFVNPGEVIAGEASFSGVSLEGTSFQSFELGGYSYRDSPTNLTATFFQVPLLN